MLNDRPGFRISIWLFVPVFLGCIQQKKPEQAIVTGPSMGNSFPGEHRQANCPDCNYPIICDAARGPDSGRTCCPMCGGMELAWQAMPQFSGTHCEIEKSGGKPERWDVFAVELPTSENGERFGIKRVIGLPGERLSFRNGDLMINGSLIHKTIDQQRLFWQPAFDSRYLPSTKGLLKRFVPITTLDDAGDGSWECSGSRLIFKAGPDSEEWHELDYVHRPGYPIAEALDSRTNFPILDHYSYNQGVSSTMLPVTDLAMEMLVDGQAGAELELVFNFRNSFRITASLRWETGNNVSVSVDGLASGRVSVSGLGKRIPVLVSVIDECCIVQINDETFFEQPYSKLLEPGVRSTTESSIPLPQLAIRARGAPMKIDEIRIWRDTVLVWSDPFDGPVDEDREVPVPAGNYFLIGDNLPVSRDSRNWPNVFVPEANVLGLVKKPD